MNNQSFDFICKNVLIKMNLQNIIQFWFVKNNYMMFELQNEHSIDSICKERIMAWCLNCKMNIQFIPFVKNNCMMFRLQNEHLIDSICKERIIACCFCLQNKHPIDSICKE